MHMHQQQSRSWSVKAAAGGKVTPSELKHVMNSLGEKAQVRAGIDPIKALGRFFVGQVPDSEVTNEEIEEMVKEAAWPWGAADREGPCEMRLTWTATGNSASRILCSLSTQGTREA